MVQICMFTALPSKLAAEPLDTPADLRYLNNSHGIAVHPLQPALDIKMCNGQGFDGKLPTEAPTYEPTSIALSYEDDGPQWNTQDGSKHNVPMEAQEEGDTQDTNTVEGCYEMI
jgi:hypothetical protein